jgi:hypothetical protein
MKAKSRPRSARTIAAQCADRLLDTFVQDPSAFDIEQFDNITSSLYDFFNTTWPDDQITEFLEALSIEMTV